MKLKEIHILSCIRNPPYTVVLINLIFDYIIVENKSTAICHQGIHFYRSIATEMMP